MRSIRPTRTAALVVGLVAVALVACSAPAERAPIGETRPDGEPERVVALGEEPLLADLLALGIPVAASSATLAGGFQGIAADAVDDIAILPADVGLEEVAALQPDAIIALEFWADRLDGQRLASIAPVTTVPDGSTAAERVAVLGDSLDLEERADALLARLETRTAEVAAALPADCAVSVVTVYAGPRVAAFVDGVWDLPAAVRSTGCELVPGTAIPHDGNGRAYLSREELGLLEAPTLLLLQSEAVDGEAEAVEEILADPLMQSLPAVQGGAVHRFDRLAYPGVEGQLRFLDEFAALG